LSFVGLGNNVGTKLVKTESKTVWKSELFARKRQGRKKN